MPDTRITVLGHPFHQDSYQQILAGLMSDPYFPVSLNSADVKARLIYETIGTEPFSIGSLHIQPVHLNHPNNGLGFRFSENGKSFVFLTDNELSYRHNGGLSFDQYVSFCRDADLLIHDGEYTREDYNRSWGHSVFTDAVRLALKANVGQLGFFHLNNMRTDRMVDAMVREARGMIRKEKKRLKCFAVGYRFETQI
jgi:phosphoribosyl 1,2-cyclic phosphodiesterase